MTRVWESALWSLVILVSLAVAQQSNSGASSTAFSSATLGFRYNPPTEMQDETQSERQKIRARAAASNTTKMLDLLLGMSSGSDSTTPGWRLLSIETYPRQAFNNLDDLRAETKMSAWVAGFSDSTVTARQVMLSGQPFAVSVFSMQAGPVRKGAVVWTTIRKGKLLSFAFVSNSPEQLKALTETMKTVQFF